jgi:AraC-like DNA-binding protein
MCGGNKMTYSFSSADFIIFSFEKRDSVPPLRKMVIPYLDITYCIEGEMEYILDGESVVLRSGDAILFPPGSERTRYFTNLPNYYASFNIMLHDAPLPQVRGKIPNCIFSDTLAMLETFKKNFYSVSLFRKEKCRDVFSYLYHQILETVMDEENYCVKRAKQYIISNLSCNLTLEMISEVVHLEPHYLCALFKQHTGSTVMQYVINQRIERAKHLIITQDEKMYRIAEKCGFANYNHFSNTFKKVTGITAAEYRNLIIK